MTFEFEPFAPLQAVWILTLWLATPFVFAALTRRRDPQLERSVGRVAFVGAPVVVTIALFASSHFRPLIDLTDHAATVGVKPHGPAVLTRPRAEPSARSGLRRPDPSNVRAETLASYDPRPSMTALAKFEGVVRLAAGSDDPQLDVEEHADLLASVSPLESRNDASSSGAIVAPAPTAGSTRTSMLFGANMRGWLIVIWAVVTFVGLHRIFSAKRGLDRLRSNWEPLPRATREKIATLGRQIGFRRRFDAYCSRSLPEAVATGWLRGALGIPTRWLASLREEEMQPLLIHEIAHLKGRDPLWRALSWLASTLLWPHPLVHWLALREATLCEIIADQEVIAAGVDGRSYAATLGRLAEERASTHGALAIAPGALGTRNSLERRIRMILESTSTPSRGKFRPAAFSILAGATLLIVLGIAHPLVGASADDGDRRDDVIKKLEAVLAERDSQIADAHDQIARLSVQLDEMRVLLERTHLGLERDAARRDAEHHERATLEAAEREIASARHDRARRVAHARLEAAESRRAVRTEQLDRFHALHKTGSVSRDEVLAAELEIVESKVELEVARAEFEELEADINAFEARHERGSSRKGKEQFEQLQRDYHDHRADYERTIELGKRGEDAAAREHRRRARRHDSEDSDADQALDRARAALHEHLERMQQYTVDLAKTLERDADEKEFDNVQFERARRVLEEFHEHRDRIQRKLHQALTREHEKGRTKHEREHEERSHRRDRRLDKAHRQFETRELALEQRREEMEVRTDRLRRQIEHAVHQRLREIEEEQEERQRHLEDEQEAIEQERANLEERLERDRQSQHDVRAQHQRDSHRRVERAEQILEHGVARSQELAERIERLLNTMNKKIRRNADSKRRTEKKRDKKPSGAIDLLKDVDASDPEMEETAIRQLDAEIRKLHGEVRDLRETAEEVIETRSKSKEGASAAGKES